METTSTSDALATLDPHYADAVRRVKQLTANKRRFGESSAQQPEH